MKSLHDEELPRTTSELVALGIRVICLGLVVLLALDVIFGDLRKQPAIAFSALALVWFFESKPWRWIDDE